MMGLPCAGEGMTIR